MAKQTKEIIEAAKLTASLPIDIAINQKLNKLRKANHNITIINNNSQTVRIFTMVALYDDIGNIIDEEGVKPFEKIIELGNDTLVDLEGNIIGNRVDFGESIPENSVGYFDYISSIINPVITTNIENGLI